MEFIGDEGKIGYIAWGFSGVFIEGCGRLIRFIRTVPVLVDVEEEITWTLYMSDEVGDSRRLIYFPGLSKSCFFGKFWAIS